MELKYTRPLIKLGKTSRALILPKSFLKKFSKIEKVIIEEYPDNLVIRFEQSEKEVKKDGSAS